MKKYYNLYRGSMRINNKPLNKHEIEKITSTGTPIKKMINGNLIDIPLNHVRVVKCTILWHIMFTLRGRKDGFRFLLPQDYIVDEINEKYAQILQEQKSFYTKPIDFVNETIKGIQILGFSEATVLQNQTAKGNNIRTQTLDRTSQNRFQHTAAEQAYRSEKNPLSLIDKTLNVTFRHTLGFLNYFMLFENFWYLYARDTQYKDIHQTFNIDLIDSHGRAYSRIVLYDPFIHSIDMLNLDYSQPIAQSETFTIVFKYSNIDYQFLEVNDEKIL